MTEPGSNEALAALLREAGRAHHDAFAHVGGDDPDWARWYADHIAPKLSGAGDQPLDPAALATALADAEQARKQQSPDADWPTYYASFLLARWPWRVRDEVPTP